MKKLLSVFLVCSLTAFISCSDSGTGPGNTGELEVVNLTEGSNQDDGYTVVVGDRQKQISAGGRIMFDDVEVGTRQVELTDIADNCSVEGNNPKSVEVTTETPGQVAFSVSCE